MDTPAQNQIEAVENSRIEEREFVKFDRHRV